jgi:hypothetical protein
MSVEGWGKSDRSSLRILYVVLVILRYNLTFFLQIFLSASVKGICIQLPCASLRLF